MLSRQVVVVSAQGVIGKHPSKPETDTLKMDAATTGGIKGAAMIWGFINVSRIPA
jgi:hypothetical protein